VMPCPIFNLSFLSSVGVSGLLVAALNAVFKQAAHPATAGEAVEAAFTAGFLLSVLALFVTIAVSEYHGLGCCASTRSFIFNALALPFTLVTLLVLVLSPKQVPSPQAFDSLHNFAVEYRTVIAVVSVFVEGLTVFHAAAPKHLELLALAAVTVAIVLNAHSAFGSQISGPKSEWALAAIKLLALNALFWFIAKTVSLSIWKGPCEFSAVSPKCSPVASHQPASPVSASPVHSSHSAAAHEDDVSFKNPEAVAKFTEIVNTPVPERTKKAPASAKRSTKKQLDDDLKLAASLQGEELPSPLRFENPGPKSPGFGVVTSRLRTRAATPKW